MNNLREVKNDLLKDWIDYRAETIFTTLNAEDKKLVYNMMKLLKVLLYY